MNTFSGSVSDDFVCILDCRKINVKSVTDATRLIGDSDIQALYGRDTNKTSRDFLDKCINNKIDEDKLEFEVTNWALRIWKPGCKDARTFSKAVRISYEVSYHILSLHR